MALTEKDTNNIRTFVQTFIKFDKATLNKEGIKEREEVLGKAYEYAQDNDINPDIFMSLIAKESSGSGNIENTGQVLEQAANTWISKTNQKNVDPNNLTMEQSFEAASWYLKEQVPAELGYHVYQNTDKGKKLREYFKNTFGLNMDKLTRTEFENAFSERLEAGVVDELTDVALGAYNEGAGNVTNAIITEGDWSKSLATNSDPHTAGYYSSWIGNLVESYRKGPTEVTTTIQTTPKVTKQPSFVENFKIINDPMETNRTLPKAKKLPSGAMDITEAAKVRNTKGNFTENLRIP